LNNADVNGIQLLIIDFLVGTSLLHTMQSLAQSRVWPWRWPKWISHAAARRVRTGTLCRNVSAVVTRNTGSQK
jgi:hypothetical protein